MPDIRRISLPDYLAAGILLLYIILGSLLVSDYGVNWDDDAQRKNGVANWQFIHGDRDPLMATTDKYHGPAWEIPMISAEKALHLTEYRDIILLRHRMSFLLYALGTGIFFLFCRKLFDSSWLGLAGFLMLVLSPRIFGEGFYNPKDTIFLVAIAAAMYSLLLLVTRPSWPHIFFHAWITAFMTDIRVIGIIFIPITLVLVAILLFQNKIDRKALGIKLLAYLVSNFLLMIAMWPVLITGPFYHLFHAYQQLSGYVAWNGLNLYNGGCVSSLSTPWHYHYLWMALTLPELYLLLFAAGLVIFAVQVVKKKLALNTQDLFIGLSLVLLAFPLVFRSIKGSVVYDGWRHVYFVYPFIVVLAVYAIDSLHRSRSIIIRYATIALVALSLSDSFIEIVRRHPFEYVYFNHVAHAIYHPVYTQFEMDYWGVGYKQAIQHLIYQYISDGPVTVSFQHYPGYRNYDMLSAEDKEKVIATDSAHAQYYITSYRDYDVCPDSYEQPGYPSHYIYSCGDRLYGIYRLR